MERVAGNEEARASGPGRPQAQPTEPTMPDAHFHLDETRDDGGASDHVSAVPAPVPTPAPVPNLVDLRRLLAERFPGAHPRPVPAVPATAAPQGWPTGIPALDTLLGGGLPRGELTELVGAGPGSGSAQVLHALLARAAADGRFLALVDGADSFDVDAAEPDQLARLLWVRCRHAGEALQAVDLILRDRNLPLVVLDLKLNPVRELRRIASSVWHRLGRIAEHNGTTLLVVTPFPLVGAVSLRLEVRAALGTRMLSATASERLDRLRFETLRAAGERGASQPAAAAG